MAVSLGHLAMFAIRSVRGLAHQRGHCDTLAWVASCCSDVQEWCRRTAKPRLATDTFLSVWTTLFLAPSYMHRP